MNKKIYLTLIACIAFVIATYAQAGALDLSFNSGTGTNHGINASAILGDGKIIIGGNFTSYNGIIKNSIARLHPDGTLDTLFNLGTGTNGNIRCVSIQDDGKIIIGGLFTSYNGVARKNIARLNADGSLDLSFNVGTGTNSDITSCCSQSDGKILICGLFTTYNGTSKNYLVRLNPNGSIDTTFNIGTGANTSSIYKILSLNDGKIMIGGSFTSYNGTSINKIARLNSNGTLDTSFHVGTGVNGTYIFDINIQGDGKIVIGGLFQDYNGTSIYSIARLNNDGTLDTTFIAPTGSTGAIKTISIQNDGKFIISGGFIYYNGIARNKIARLNSDGTLDVSFNPGTGASSSIETNCIQSDGKIIIGGQFSSYNGTTIKHIARIQNDGTVNISNITGFDANIKCFPNPTNGEFIIQSEELNGAIIRVYNNVGQLILEEKNISDNNLTLDLNKHNSGLFIVEITQEKFSRRFKVSKM